MSVSVFTPAIFITLSSGKELKIQPGAATPSLLGQARLILVDLGYLQIGSNWMIKCDGFGVVLMYMLVRAISNDSTVQARKV